MTRGEKSHGDRRIGQTEFSKNIGRPEKRIALEAIQSALDDAGLAPEDVDGLVRFNLDSSNQVEAARSLGIPNLKYFGELGYGGGSGCAGGGFSYWAPTGATRSVSRAPTSSVYFVDHAPTGVIAAYIEGFTVHDAVFHQYGVIRVDDLDELLETSGLFTREAPSPRAIASASMRSPAAPAR